MASAEDSPTLCMPKQVRFKHLWASSIADEKGELIDQLEFEEERNNLKEAAATCNQLTFSSEVANDTNFINGMESDILHISCHGRIDSIFIEHDTKSGMPSNILGTAKRLESGRVHKILSANENRPKLVFMSSCQSAGFASIFVELGVRHVVAIDSQLTITETASLNFARMFYSKILTGSSVKSAFKSGIESVRLASLKGEQEYNKFVLLPRDGDDHDEPIFSSEITAAADTSGGFTDKSVNVHSNLEISSVSYVRTGYAAGEAPIRSLYQALHHPIRLVAVVGKTGSGKSALVREVLLHSQMRCEFKAYMRIDLKGLIKERVMSAAAEGSEVDVSAAAIITLYKNLLSVQQGATFGDYDDCDNDTRLELFCRHEGVRDAVIFFDHCDEWYMEPLCQGSPDSIRQCVGRFIGLTRLLEQLTNRCANLRVVHVSRGRPTATSLSQDFRLKQCTITVQPVTPKENELIFFKHFRPGKSRTQFEKNILNDIMAALKGRPGAAVDLALALDRIPQEEVKCSTTRVKFVAEATERARLFVEKDQQVKNACAQLQWELSDSTVLKLLCIRNNSEQVCGEETDTYFHGFKVFEHLVGVDDASPCALPALSKVQIALEESFDAFPYNFIYVHGDSPDVLFCEKLCGILARYNKKIEHKNIICGVLLNFSNSADHGQKLLSELGVNNVIGINGAASTETLDSFSTAFFDVLVVHQLGNASILQAYESARSLLDTQGGPFKQEALCFNHFPSPPPISHRKLTERWEQKLHEKTVGQYAENTVDDESLNIQDEQEQEPLVLRPYQEELFQQACDHNIVVCLPTGTGKTLVAFELMSHLIKQEQANQEAEQHDRGLGRPVLFLTQNVTLMFQQAKACKEQTKLRVGTYCGGESTVGSGNPVDDKSLTSVWRQEIAGKQACFFTAGLFENLCKSPRDIFSFLDFSLVVIDEAHHTKKNHKFNVLIKEHYMTIPDPTQRPKILALSATLAEPRGDLTATIDATLETARALDCRLCIPQTEEGKRTLMEAINLPTITFKEVSPQPEYSRWLEMIPCYVAGCVDILCSKHLPKEKLTREECEKLDVYTNISSYRRLLNRLDDCLSWARETGRLQFVFILTHIIDILETCNISTGFVAEAIKGLSYKLQKLQQDWGSIEDVSPEVSLALSNMISSSKLFQSLTDGAMDFGDALSPQTFQVLDIFKKLKLSLSPDASVMVFCTTRASAVSLASIINSQFGPGIAANNSDCGGGGGGGGCVDAKPTHFHPIADFITGHGNPKSEMKGMSHREQLEKSEAFKDGRFNVLVSTSVCKEGIDVGTCKVGIEHGGLISSTELTQFIGRECAPEMGKSSSLGLRNKKSALTSLLKEGRDLQKLSHKRCSMTKRYEFMNIETSWRKMLLMC